MKITNTKIYEQVADDIIEQIKEGKLQTGDKLPSIQKLATSYGVSVASIREALNALRMIGLIEIKHGYGTFIKQKEPQFFDLDDQNITKKQILDLLELRETVENGSVKFAAQRRETDDISAMRQALEKMKHALSDGTSGEEADLMFHMAIAKASKNQMLIELLENISDLIKTTMKQTRKMYIYGQMTKMEILYQEHITIYNAIEQGDAAKAEKAMKEHLEEVKKTILAHINDSN